VPTVEDARRLALGMPEASEKPCFGTPGFYVRKKLFARVKEDGESIVVKVDFGEREALVSEQPETFVVTPHYADYPMVIVRLPTVDPEELRELLTEAWRRCAPSRMLAAYDAAHPPAG
jgi:hypothetical protein